MPPLFPQRFFKLLGILRNSFTEGSFFICSKGARNRQDHKSTGKNFFLISWHPKVSVSNHCPPEHLSSAAGRLHCFILILPVEHHILCLNLDCASAGVHSTRSHISL